MADAVMLTDPRTGWEYIVTDNRQREAYVARECLDWARTWRETYGRHTAAYGHYVRRAAIHRRRAATLVDR